MNSFFPTQAKTTNCHLMVDLETLATHTAAPILAIGAVLFDPTAHSTFEELRADSFLALIDPADAVNVCGPVDGDTLRWWFRQEDAAIKRLVTGKSLTVRDALTQLFAYARSHNQVPTHVWARSPDFDCSILQSACKATATKYPFPFYMQRCVRTAIELAFPNGDDPKFREAGLKHDARDDAVTQALIVQACYQALHLCSASV
jgi:hypothetical protein